MRRRDYRTAATLLERCLAGGANDVGTYMRLAAARRAVGDAAGALDPIGAVLRIEPRNFPAWLMGGSLLRVLGRNGEAARAYASALEVAPPLGSLPPPYVQELDVARQHIAREQVWRRSVADIVLTDPNDPGSDSQRLEQLRADIVAGRKSADGIEFAYPGLPEVGFYEAEAFDGIAELQAGTATIADEFRAAARASSAARVSMAAHAGALAGERPDMTQSRQWSAIPLIAEGTIVEANAALCPETLRLYLALQPPRIAGRSPNLMFSLLDPHTRIPAHRGVANTRLVMHLPLVIPADCAIRVGDDTRPWVPGHALVFDDTLEHEAWNDSDEQRVVLLGDIWRPELSGRERTAIASLMATPGA